MRATAAKGRYPYPHRTVAEIDAICARLRALDMMGGDRSMTPRETVEKVRLMLALQS